MSKQNDEPHNIPSWYIPDEEVVLANEHEREQIEEEGELDEALCPHCGAAYEKKDGGYYIHRWRPVDGEDWGEWEPRTDGHPGWAKSTKVTPATWCEPSGKKRHDKQQPWGYQDF